MKYMPELDGIRAFAAILIAFYHSEAPGLTGGFFAVDIFFVLSGFLVTQLLDAKYRVSGRLGWGVFVARRLSRLMPALALMLIAYLCAAPLMWGGVVPIQKHMLDALLTITYVVNWIQSFGGQVAVLGHVWSLAIEMQFYLIWPLVMLVVVRLSRAGGLFLLAFLYVSATLWRGIGSMGFESVWEVYTRTDMHISGLLLGSFLALLPDWRCPRLIVPALLLIAFCLTFFSTHWDATVRYGFTMAEIGAALLILSRPPWLGNALLVWLGQISYGIYLWHFPIVLYLRLQDMPWLQVFLYGLTVSIVLASLSYYFVETRFHTPIQRRRLATGRP